MIGKSRGKDIKIITHEFNLKCANVLKEIVKGLITFQSTGTNRNSGTNNYDKLITQFVLAITYVQKCRSYAQCFLHSQLQVFHFTAPQMLLLTDVTLYPIVTFTHYYFSGGGVGGSQVCMSSIIGCHGQHLHKYFSPFLPIVLELLSITIPLPRVDFIIKYSIAPQYNTMFTSMHRIFTNTKKPYAVSSDSLKQFQRSESLQKTR